MSGNVKVRKVILITCQVIIICVSSFIGFFMQFKHSSYAYSDTHIQELLKGDYVPDELIIGFKDISEFPDQEEQYQNALEKIKKLQKIGVQQINERTFVIKVEDLKTDPFLAINRYKDSKFVDYVEPNYIGQLCLVPNDPNYKSQSPVLTCIGAQAGWDIITGGGPPIAVIDTGITSSHPDMRPLLPGYTYNGVTADLDGHGSGVAGTIGMIGNNGVGGVGINWNAKIIPVKTSTTAANVSECLIWAADNGAKIINLSLGWGTTSSTLENAIDYAYNNGCVIFAASGNEAHEGVCYPARYSNVMAVGSTTNGTSRVAGSNWGIGLNLIGFGGWKTITPNGGYTDSSGTSFSTPQVAALASLVLEILPDLTQTELYELIQNNCKKIAGKSSLTGLPYVYDANGWNIEVGYGLIDIGATLAAAQTIANGFGQLPGKHYFHGGAGVSVPGLRP